VERTWSLPESGSGVGEAGVRSLAVSIDGSGRPAATWIEGGPATSRVVVAEAAGGGFEEHYPAAALPGEAAQPDVALGPDGAAVAVWKQQLLGGEARVFVAERESGGGWKDPSSIEEAFSFAPTAFEPKARFFPSGERIVVWNQWMSTGYGVQLATRPKGGDWHRPEEADDILSQPVFFSNAPNIAVNERGDGLISWYQSLGGSLLAWQSERFGPDGEFSRPGPEEYLSVPDTPVDSHPFANPKPALSSAGDGAVVWTQEDGAGSVPVYMATRTPDGAWTKPASVEDALSTRPGYARCPQPAFTPSGDLFVVWYQDTGEGNRVVAAHRSPDGEWLEPGSEPTLLSTPGVPRPTAPVLVVGSRGQRARGVERAAGGWLGDRGAQEGGIRDELGSHRGPERGERRRGGAAGGGHRGAGGRGGGGVDSGGGAGRPDLSGHHARGVRQGELLGRRRPTRELMQRAGLRREAARAGDDTAEEQHRARMRRGRRAQLGPITASATSLPIVVRAPVPKSMSPLARQPRPIWPLGPTATTGDV
jgi:hypothetical protein